MTILLPALNQNYWRTALLEPDKVGDKKTIPVVIVGAGAAGLTMAFLCEKYGIEYVLLEKRKEPSRLSKATGIHRNTMRLFYAFGLSEEIIAVSILLSQLFFIKDSEHVRTIKIEQGELTHDKNISINQFDLEGILRKCLRNAILIEHEVVSVSQNEDGASCLVKYGEKNIEYSCKHLVAADGASSVIRSAVGIDFPGEITPEISFTFDATIEAKKDIEQNTMYMFTKDEERLAVVPLPGENQYKFAGKLPEDSPAELTTDFLYDITYKRSTIQIKSDTITGVSTYQTQCHLADMFSKGSIVLIGDAAHTFFPAGGYGLNAAIEDAFCLAWRLKADQPITYTLVSEYCLFRRKEVSEIQDDAKVKKEQSLKLEPAKDEGEKAILETQSYVSADSDAFRRLSNEEYYEYFLNKWRKIESSKIEGVVMHTFFKLAGSDEKVLVLREPDLRCLEIKKEQIEGFVKKFTL